MDARSDIAAHVRPVVKAGIAALVVGWRRGWRGEGWKRNLDVQCLTFGVLEAEAIHEPEWMSIL